MRSNATEKEGRQEEIGRENQPEECGGTWNTKNDGLSLEAAWLRHDRTINELDGIQNAADVIPSLWKSENVGRNEGCACFTAGGGKGKGKGRER